MELKITPCASRNALLMNSLSSPTYLPSSMDRMRSEGSAGQAGLEQEFLESLRAQSAEFYQQQVCHSALVFLPHTWCCRAASQRAWLSKVQACRGISGIVESVLAFAKLPA